MVPSQFHGDSIPEPGRSGRNPFVTEFLSFANISPMNSSNDTLARRQFIRSAFMLGVAGLWLPRLAGAASASTKDPLTALRLAWTDKLRWDFAVDITSVAGAGEFWDERLEQSQIGRAHV